MVELSSGGLKSESGIEIRPSLVKFTHIEKDVATVIHDIWVTFWTQFNCSSEVVKCLLVLTQVIVCKASIIKVNGDFDTRQLRLLIGIGEVGDSDAVITSLKV